MFRLRSVVTFAFALVAAATPAFAADVTWTLDSAHSSAEFGIKHFALSSVKGTFPIKSGAVVIPAGKDIPTSVQALLDVGAVDTKDPGRDRDLRSDHWLDTDKYPLATFTSTKIEGTDPGKFTITGDLTLHGVTKSETLEAHLEGRGAGGHGEKRVAYSAVGTIHRRDFAIVDSRTNALGALIVGDDAAISIQVEGVAQP